MTLENTWRLIIKNKTETCIDQWDWIMNYLNDLKCELEAKCKWRIANVNKSYIEINWKSIYITNWNNIIDKMEDLNIYKEGIWWELEKLPIPKLIRKKLAIYLSIRHKLKEILKLNEEEWFDCLSFVYFLLWIPYKNNNMNINYWLKKQIKFNNLWSIKNHFKPWEILLIWEKGEKGNLLYDLKKNTYHFAVYLWKWLWISKYGKNNTIKIWNIESLNNSYPFDTAYRMVSNY